MIRWLYMRPWQQTGGLVTGVRFTLSLCQKRTFTVLPFKPRRQERVADVVQGWDTAWGNVTSNPDSAHTHGGRLVYGHCMVW